MAEQREQTTSFSDINYDGSHASNEEISHHSEQGNKVINLSFYMVTRNLPKVF